MGNINDFKSNIGIGVRANLFKVFINYPLSLNTGRSAEFLVKAAQLPGSNIGVVPVPFRGRQIPVPGDRTFTEWTVTVMNDESFAHRNALESWMNAIHQHDNTVGAVNNLQIYGSGTVQQLSREGKTIKNYSMTDIFPTEVAPIDVAFDTNDTIEEFTVTFQILEWGSIESVVTGAGTLSEIPNVAGVLGQVGNLSQFT